MSDISIEQSDEATVSRAFRIRKSELQILQKEAKERNVNVNIIVNELIAKHVHFERVSKKYHPMWASSAMLKLFADEVPQDKIIKIAERLANEVPSLPLELSGDSSALGILKAQKIFCIYSGSNEYTEEEFDDKKVIILVHDVGKNFSLFEATFWKTLLNRAGAEVSTSLSETAVMFEVAIPKSHKLSEG